jgi:predicted RNase H-like HicB family nuclease
MTGTNSRKAKYHASFELEESGTWIASIDEIPQVHTYGRTLGKAREYVADALALWLNASVDNVKSLIECRPAVLPSTVQNAVDVAASARTLAESANSAAATLLSNAALALTNDAQLSMRDAAELLGISYQRVHQLVSPSSGNR